MRKIIFIQRNKKAGFSIDKVSRPIINKIENRSEISVPRRRATLKDILQNILYVYRHREKGAIHHITGDIHYCILALIGMKTVLTVHDTVTIDYDSTKGFKHFLKKLLWFTLPLKIADKVVCISEETRRQLSKYTKRDDILVIHNSVDPDLNFFHRNPIKSEFRVLMIGTKKNKNVERCIKALSGFDCEITIIGKLSIEQQSLLERENVKYYNKYNLSNQEVQEEYKKTDLVLFVSLFEGFGMPILEANKVGRPIICSNIPVLKEVGGSAALYVNPNDIVDIRNGIYRLINDIELQKRLVLNGIKNAEEHSITSIIRKWNMVYSSF